MSRLPHKPCKRGDCPDCRGSQVHGISESTKQPSTQLSQENSQKQNLVAPIHHSENQSQNQSDSATDQNPLNPDPISENPDQNNCCGHAETQNTIEILPNWLDTWSPEQIKIWQENDECISKILQLKTQFQQKPPKTEILPYPNMVKTLWSLWETLEVHDGILYIRWVTEISPEGYILQLVVL